MAGSWKTFIQRFSLKIEIKQRELGVDGDNVEIFDDESKLLAFLKTIDWKGNEVLTAEGLAWVDGTMTYDLTMQALIRCYSREESL